MFIEESLWIKTVLNDIKLPVGCSILDVGSSTTQFRKVDQPHIDSNVFHPLRKRGYKLYHIDAKQGDGINIVCDLTDPHINKLKNIERRFELVICSNLLEHVMNVRGVAKIVSSLAKFNGYLLVTVPKLYRKHNDPIDNMFRPSPIEIEELFCSVDTSMVTVVSKVITINHRMYYPVYESRYPLWGYRDVLRYLFPWRRWKVSCLLLKKTGKI